MQDFLGASDAVVDNAFFDQTNQQSFVDNKLPEIVKPTHQVDASCYTLNLEDVTEESFWAAYPNPVYDNLHINPLDEAVTLVGYRVVDTIGRTVKNGKLNFEHGHATIDMMTTVHGAMKTQSTRFR